MLRLYTIHKSVLDVADDQYANVEQPFATAIARD